MTTFKKRAVAAAVASCIGLIPALAAAAGLGRINVLSGLGEPLRAEVEISATRAELTGMTARLAPVDAFRDAGVDFSTALSDLRFSIEKRSGDKAVIKVTSSRPMNEPFLDFLVELNWASGRVVREYTFLLDPPEVAARPAGKPVSSAEARVVETVRGSGAAPSAVAPAPAPAPAPRAEAVRREAPPPKPAPAPRAADAPGTHRVQPGETLRRIAGETKHEGVSLEQMMVGLFNANRQAFIGDNVNRVKSGAILAIPDKQTVAAIPQAEARKVYSAGDAEWNRYTRKAAAEVAAAPPKPDGATQAAAGKVTPRVEDKTPPAERPKDQVKVSRTEAPAKAGAAGKPGVSEEDLVAKERALKEAGERISQLEKNVADLQKLVDMKTQRLAELQQQASAPKPPAVAAAPAEAPKPAEMPKPVEAAKPAEPPKPVEPPKAAEPPKAPEPPPVPAPEAAKPAEAPKPVEPPKPAETPKPAEPPKPAEAKKAAPPPAPEPEPGMVDQLLAEPLPLLAGGGVLALLAALFVMKRRRSGEPPLAEPPSTTPGESTSLGPNSVFKMTGGQSVDTANLTAHTADFSQAGPGLIDTDDVDPVAEADVYMAYGRDTQAEEILIEALRKDPHRVAIHVKLLEIYANRRSLKQFDTLASELYAQTGGVGSEWEKAAAMGIALDPRNPLYRAEAKSAGEPAAKDIPAGAATVVMPGALGMMAAAASEPAPALELPPVTLPEEPAPAVEPAAVDLDFALPATPAAAPEPANAFTPEGTLIIGAGEADRDFAETMVAADTSAGEELVAEAGALDFDLATPAPPASPAPEPAAAPAIEEIAALDFSLGADAPAPAVADESGTATIVNPDMLRAVTAADADAMTLDFGAETAAAPEPAPAFDMTSINLDLSTDTPAEAAAPEAGSDEAGTKLALARAYVEMGAQDQARELLDELIAESPGAVADQARELLGRLSG